MKTASITVEFTSHVLANGSERDSTADRFAHTSDGSLIFQQSWWYASISNALRGAGIRGLKPADIAMDLVVHAKTGLFERRFGEGGKHFRVHEAIFPGTRVVFNALVADHVTDSVLRTFFDRLGRFTGISPYGFALGFGRFVLLDVSVQPSDAQDTKQEA